MDLKFLTNNLLLQVFLATVCAVLLAPHLSEWGAACLYSISQTIRDLLTLFLPLIVFSYLVAAIIAYEGDASKVLIGIFTGVVISFVLALTFVYIVGEAFLPHFVARLPQAVSESTQELKALWGLPIKGPSTDMMMLLAIGIGLWFNILNSSTVQTLRKSHYEKSEGLPATGSDRIKGVLSAGVFARVEHLESFRRAIFWLRGGVEKALMKCFVPIIPLYVLGFMVKLSYESTSNAFLREFGFVILFNFICILLFLFLDYLVAARFQFKTMASYIKNILPATFTAFSTMSSVATMPVTISAVEKNLGGDPHFAKLVIPTTVNPHAIGDVINVSLSGLALLVMAGQSLPSLPVYAVFAFYIIVAQFACVSVPGGGIIVMQGVLQKHLGLDSSTVMLLVSIYFLLEPVLTATNVTYNGSFVINLRRALSRFIKNLDVESANLKTKI